MKKALFLDRDGVVNHLVKKFSKSYNQVMDDTPFDLSEFKFREGIRELVNVAKQKGYFVIIVTNQPSYLKEDIPIRKYEEITTKICNYLELNRSYVFECFHKQGFSLECNCRKPKPGLFYMAKGMHNLNLKESIMVGDSWTDILAANSAKVGKAIFLRRKNNPSQIGNLEDEQRMKKENINPTAIVDSLKEVLHYL